MTDPRYPNSLRDVLRRRWPRIWVAGQIILRLTDRGTWVSEGVLGCAYPRSQRAFANLSRRGVQVLVNLHEKPHDPHRLVRNGMREVHLPVKDFTAPTEEQMEHGVAAILESRAAGESVAVHCGGGLGRTGTLLACYLVCSQGLGAGEAIGRIREQRPGSIETVEQVAAVEVFERSTE